MMPRHPSLFCISYLTILYPGEANLHSCDSLVSWSAATNTLLICMKRRISCNLSLNPLHLNKLRVITGVVIKEQGVGCWL